MSTPHEAPKGPAGGNREKKTRPIRSPGPGRPASARTAGGARAKKQAVPVPPGAPEHLMSPEPHPIDRMVAEAAYYLAEKRNFAPGHEEEDWLAAREQVSAQLRDASRPLRKD